MRPRTLGLVFVLALAALVAAAVWMARPERAADTRLSLAEAMRSDTTGFARAVGVRPFDFPRDHGPHPDFRTEWWYLTGNLDAARPDGSTERVGVDLTIFRIALTASDSAVGAGGVRSVGTDTVGWATRQMFMAHVGVTDAAGRRFVASERFSRGAAGLAGARAPAPGAGLRVWVDDWEIAEGPGGLASSPGGLPTFRVRASAGAGDSLATFDLTLRAEKPPVLQGEAGLSQKGPAPGNASYYYSLPRLAATGTLTRGTREATVTGTLWMDREWSTSALGPDEVGWDWFALHLADGRDVMLYRLRRRDGTAAPLSKGSVSPAGGDPARRLALADYTLRPVETWTSPHSGARYPVTWEVDVPSENLRLRVRAVLPDQELNVSVRYWEGAVDVTDAVTGAPLGRGYLEMTGYGDEGRAARGTRASG